MVLLTVPRIHLVSQLWLRPAAQASAHPQVKLEAWLLLFILLFCGYVFSPVLWEIKQDDRLQHLRAGGNGAAVCVLLKLFQDSSFL